MANSNGAEIASNPDIPPDAAQGGALNTELNQQDAPTQSIEDQEAHHKSKRTLGLKLFDVLLYPLLNNVSVFIISVGATYLTTRGSKINPATGELQYGKIGKFFQERGDWLTHKLEQKLGMPHQAADMSKMVAFSFIDGSVVAPAIKVLEDHREHIAQGLDTIMGTTPEDKSVYKAEPKQSWSSVLGGRLATVAVVVPTAVILEKTHINAKNILTGTREKMNLNEFMFNNPGLYLGKKAQEKGMFKGFSTKHDITEVSRVSLFEGFYTSVCTGGLYFTSRFFARKQGDKREAKAANTNAAPIASSAANTNAAPVTVEKQPTAANLNEAPGTKLHAAEYDNTISTAPEKALAAG